MKLTFVRSGDRVVHNRSLSLCLSLSVSPEASCIIYEFTLCAFITLTWTITLTGTTHTHRTVLDQWTPTDVKKRYVEKILTTRKKKIFLKSSISESTVEMLGKKLQFLGSESCFRANQFLDSKEEERCVNSLTQSCNKRSVTWKKKKKEKRNKYFFV